MVNTNINEFLYVISVDMHSTSHFAKSDKIHHQVLMIARTLFPATLIALALSAALLSLGQNF